MMKQHTAREVNFRKPAQILALLRVGIITLILMTLSLSNAQGVTIDYTLTDTGNPNLAGIFSYNTVTMMISNLDVTLTTGPDTIPFNQTSQATVFLPVGDVLELTAPPLPPSMFNIVVGVELGVDLGVIPPSNQTFLWEIVSGDVMGPNNGQGIVTATTPPGSAVPEPGTALLLATGLLGLAGYRWTQRQHQDKIKS